MNRTTLFPLPEPAERGSSALVRSIAGLIDRGAFFVLGAGLNSALGWHRASHVVDGRTVQYSAQNHPLLALLATPVLLVLTSTLPLALRGRTLGKWAMGLRMVPARVGTSRWRPALIRAVISAVLLLAISGVFLPVYGLWCIANVVGVARDPDGRSYYDRLSGSLVVGVPHAAPPIRRAASATMHS